MWDFRHKHARAHIRPKSQTHTCARTPIHTDISMAMGYWWFVIWVVAGTQDDVTGKTISSGSGGRPATGYMSTTGQAAIIGDDPFNLTITEVATFPSSTYPYEGRYPCGSLMKDDTWWYGQHEATAQGHVPTPLHSHVIAPLLRL